MFESTLVGEVGAFSENVIRLASQPESANGEPGEGGKHNDKSAAQPLHCSEGRKSEGGRVGKKCHNRYMGCGSGARRWALFERAFITAHAAVMATKDRCVTLVRFAPSRVLPRSVVSRTNRCIFPSSGIQAMVNPMTMGEEAI